MNELQTNVQSCVDRPASYGGAAKILANMDAEAILQNAPPKLLEAVAKAVMARRLTDRLDAAAKLAGIDYFAEKETFLNNAGRTQSRHTRRTYANALGKLEAYATRAKIKTLELTPAQADNFIYEQKAGGASVTIGGPGGLFWMWIAVFIGMLVKYAEIFLSIKYRVENEQGGYDGGAPRYLMRAFNKKWISIIFCILMCVYGTEIYQFKVVEDTLVDILGLNRYLAILLVKGEGLKIDVG